MPTGFIAVAVAAAAFALAGLRKPKEGTRLAVFRLGTFSRVSGPGLTFVIPVIEKGTAVELTKAVPGYQEGYPEQQLKERLRIFVMRAAPPRGGEPAPDLDPELKPFVEWLVAQASGQTGASLYRDEMALRRIAESAMTARDALELQDRVRISLPFLASDSSGPKHFELDLTKEDLQRHL